VHDDPATHGLDMITMLGEQCPGYQFNPLCPQKAYTNLVTALKNTIGSHGQLFVLLPATEHAYVEQQFILGRFLTWLPELQNKVVDISAFVARLRRTKDMREIEALYKAVEITQLAQEAAAQAIAPGVTECEVQASLEYIMIASGARPAFPSIVATGKNATILHYMNNSATIQPGDLVVVDIGAEYNYYCADLTRTYPASGTFTQRQRELYDVVLETQEYVAEHTRPGMWLSNKEQPDKSLHHRAVNFLAKKGYDKFFIHSIGHFLGLDVHDVGDPKKPLQEGDVITIEPGLYIPEEGIGIRIEDNYWVVQDGVVCLSENLPKKADEIELLVQQNWEEKGPEHDDEHEEEYVFEEEDIDEQVKH
jgi:Xaa-Pro aminopeptidase